MGDSWSERAQGDQFRMKLLPTFAFLGLTASSYGAPQYYGYQNVPVQSSYPYSLAFFNNPYNPVQPQPAVLTRTASNTVNNAPLGLTVDFDSSFGSFPLGTKNELTPAQRNILLPVMEALLKTLETDVPSARDMNTLMILVRDLLKLVPEGETPNPREYGFDADSIPFGMDLDTLKNVALPATGDIVVTVNSQDKIVTGFGSFPLKSFMNKADREKFLPALKAFTNLLKKNILNKAETEELLGLVRKLDTWNLFPFDVRDSNEPKKKKGFGSTFNLGALSGLIGGLVNAQMSESFF